MTRRFGHGLVVGSFYPPHAGHDLLISAAAAACDAVTVVVAPSTGESAPLGLRLRWLREQHAHEPHVRFTGRYDDTRTDYDDPAIWDLHVALFASLLDRPVDAVFSSEPYGDELARRFGAAHVPVDVTRSRVPVSGTAVRSDVVAHWSSLGPGVRAWLARRVVVVGAESTGTTTLARSLAVALRARGGVWARTCWAPEHGRVLTARKLSALRAASPGASVFDVTWSDADFVEVARVQNAWEDSAARRSSPVVVCDTDALATTVWQERYRGAATPAVTRLVRPADLYLLTGHEDVPFTDDGLRDGEHVREWMTGRFAEVLAGRPHVRVSGTREERLAQALAAVDALLARGWRFAPRV